MQEKIVLKRADGTVLEAESVVGTGQMLLPDHIYVGLSPNRQGRPSCITIANRTNQGEFTYYDFGEIVVQKLPKLPTRPGWWKSLGGRVIWVYESRAAAFLGQLTYNDYEKNTHGFPVTILPLDEDWEMIVSR